MQTKYQMIRSILETNQGRFLTVSFRKKDGTMRRMNIQPAAVKTHLSVDPNPSAVQGAETRRRNNPNLIPVYDVQKGSIRSINVDTISSIRANKITFNVEV
jgi:hypothetical protein